MSDKGRPLPKFGEWDVNDPASAEGFTVIFNKARDERKTGGNAQGSDSKTKNSDMKPAPDATRYNSKKWLCCIHPTPAES
ncbi:hypothetical protein HPP92_020140 [Vanilla planifolia]|uniref:RIN4 pathogenic type III effector avirulence factor Avr cleavage site domain-containing protein n=1 Tax=Vanilla planifolia TaxID=51239 RepID=A0A835Q881_VANPL|nr:hypothetical protein HPP92_020592 [Vanilla planifolia]KAG0465976.1 hypothetical protein HPP92_020140 [Vanilla planifolia]